MAATPNVIRFHEIARPDVTVVMLTYNRWDLTREALRLLAEATEPRYDVVIVDNGRSAILEQPTFRRSLSCIRCGACMNTCPVFRRSGGYSYGYTVPGPIGSLLGPLRDPQKYGSLPFASKTRTNGVVAV